MPHRPCRCHADNRNQVFATADFAPLVRKMQVASLDGRGIVVRQEMETVENTFWGVQAGIKSNVTWVYLDRATKWEAQLSGEMQKLVVPRRRPQDPANTVDSGPFKNFPHYTTSDLALTHSQSNLLADLSGWVTQANEEIFRAALQ